MRVLYLTHRLPYAPNRGDRLRAYHQLLELRRWAEVHLISLVHSPEEEARVAELSGIVASVRIARVGRWSGRARAALAVPTSRPLTHVLLDSPELRPAIHEVVARTPPDLVFSYCTGMAHVALERPLAGLPLVIDFVDVDSAKWRAMGGRTRGPLGWIYRREARCLEAFEREAATHAAATLVVNAREAAALRAVAPAARHHVVPNGVDLESFAPRSGAASAPVVVLSGVLDYPPNVEGALWFARTVWPAVRKGVPDARLVLAGASPVSSVRALAADDRTITVTGTVPDVREHLWSSAVAVAPLFTARGVQNKVLEAAAAGLPSVVTSVVREGLPEEVLPACTVADDSETFAAAVTDLLRRSAGERRALAARAQLYRLTWRERLAPLEAIVRGAAEITRDGRVA